jgi:phosphonate transport system permease protein
VRLVLNVLRSIPELVWAVILLIAAGLGPFAGTLALAIHTSGVLGRLFADALENLPPAAENTLRINGAGALNAFFYAALPQILPQLMSYTLYRWENNIRAAAILGIVGAGGLGQMLKYHLSLFQMQQAATVIIAMLLMITVVDAVSFWLRRRITGNH